MLRIITLFFALSLILTVSYPVVNAHNDTPLTRRHPSVLKRMMKKRASFVDNNNAAGAGSAQQAPNDAVAQQPSAASPSPTDPAKTTDTQAAGNNNQPVVTPKTSAVPIVVSTQTLSPAAQATTPTASALLPNVNTILGLGSPSNTSVSNTPSASSSSVSSSSLPPTLSSSSLTPSSTQSSTPTSNSLAQTGVDAITVTSTPPPSASATGSPTSGSVTKIQRNTIIILVAIGGSIGAAGIIWTIIRKWKLGPSSSFEDRMQPIDWQPTAAPHEEHDITEKLTRNGSVRSHGSFTSGNNHDTLPVDLPPHDFTAGPAHLAPVGGYADLQRGPSPQPDMQHPQSFRTPSPYEYDMPNPHGQYYNGAGAGAGAGASAGYPGGYDFNRGY